MEDYKNMYPASAPQPDGQNNVFPDPAAAPVQDFANLAAPAEAAPNPSIPVQAPVQEIPQQPQPQPMPAADARPAPSPAPAAANTSVSYDTFYTAGSTPPPPRVTCPPPPKPENPAINRRVYTAAAISGVLIFLLCIYCIAADLIHGALDTNTETGSDNANVEVVVQTQKKPALDPDDENVTADGEYTVKGVAEIVKPSIVEVYAYSNTEPSEDTLAGTGSGIIISEDGYIITNAHVVEGECFTVILDDESEYDAAVIGSDSKTDLAVLKISAEGLTAAVLGDSDEVYVGENVVAIGNPAGLTNTVTKGIVSAINRQIRAESNAFVMDCIQTDAAISPGNSGGALVNMYGQVIGITSSKYASSYMDGTAYEGLGFAITINQALPIVEELISQGYVSGRFRIGITFMEADTEYSRYYFETEYGYAMPEELSGLWVSEISEDCDIANTELAPNDFILSMNGTPVDNYDDVRAVLDGFHGGDTVTADCARIDENGEVSYFTIEFMLESDTSGDF